MSRTQDVLNQHLVKTKEEKRKTKKKERIVKNKGEAFIKFGIECLFRIVFVFVFWYSLKERQQKWQL